LKNKKNRAVPAVSVIVAGLGDLMNDQVSSLQRKGIAANLHPPFHRLYFPFIATDSQHYLIKRDLQN